MVMSNKEKATGQIAASPHSKALHSHGPKPKRSLGVSKMKTR
uniref:Uncharacterized protein n=1 Tax=Anguilla anguilla TaxID=7936 RepID=A0A0E9VGA0_ANGAN